MELTVRKNEILQELQFFQGIVRPDCRKLENLVKECVGTRRLDVVEDV